MITHSPLESITRLIVDFYCHFKIKQNRGSNELQGLLTSHYRQLAKKIPFIFLFYLKFIHYFRDQRHEQLFHRLLKQCNLFHLQLLD